MDSVELSGIERRARMHYEWGRARRAFVGFAPVLLVVAGAAALSAHPVAAAACGLVAFAVGAAMLWYGRELKRSVLPGAAAGLVPVALALGASHIGYVCTGNACTMVCVSACAAGGLFAGAVVARAVVRRQAGVPFLLSASSIALAMGATGCTCAGYFGVLGLVVGYGAGLAPSLVAFAWRPR